MNRILAVVLGVCLLASAGSALAQDDDADPWYSWIAFSGYLDTRVSYYSFTPDVDVDDFDVSSSDISVFESALAATMTPTEFVESTVVLYFVDGARGVDTDLNLRHHGEGLTVDEYYLILKYAGAYAKLGKYYPPIGDFTTYGISYTRVQDLFWTRASAAGLGYDHDYFSVSAHAFNGAFDQVEFTGGVPEVADDNIDTFAAALSVNPLAGVDDYDLTIGGYFLSDATETLAGLGSLLATTPFDPGTPLDPSDDSTFVEYDADTPLFGGFLTAELTFSEMFALGLAGEYATTGEWDDALYMDAAGEATAISAAHGEIAGLFNDKKAQVGGRMDMVSGLDWLGTAGLDPTFEPTTYTQFGGFVGIDYIEYVHLAVQLLAGSDSDSNTDLLGEFQARLNF
ncbi:hypothetical protein K8I61_03770 [bacterium]|nr:hypothetical protein [bacterium]